MLELQENIAKALSATEKEKRRLSGKAHRLVPSPVPSGPDAALYFVRKISGRPRVPGTLLQEPGTSGQPEAGVRLILPVPPALQRI